MNMATDQDEELFEVICEENENSADVYQCSACNMSFPDVDEHLKQYHGEEPVAEEKADIADEAELGVALVMKTVDGKFKCSRCQRTYKLLKRYMEHMKTHGALEDNVLSLEECLDQTEKQETIYEELLVNGQVNYKCIVCNTVFDSRKKVILHFPIHRNVAAAQKRQKLENSSVELFNCKLCNRSLNNAYEMKMHLNAHEENTAHGSRQKAESESKAAPKLKKTSEGKAPYSCQYCGKEFKRPHEKVKHERIHTNSRPFACEICNKTFRVTYCLSLHKRNVHSDERPYICSIEGCNKRFKSQSVYNHHLKTHGTAKNFKCPFCEKAFKTSVQLAGHKNTHTKPFPCQVCSRAFSSLYAVKIHMEVHKTHEKNLKYTCQICSAQYGRSFALSDHMKSVHSELAHDLDTDEVYEIEEMQETETVGEIYSVMIE